LKRVRALVSGRVQGVCFRAFTRDMAERLGVCGYVRNLPDGTVEIVAEGEDGDVDALMEWASRGPTYSRVTGVSVTESEFRGDQLEFSIRH
jgi:acylphosphatase